MTCSAPILANLLPNFTVSIHFTDNTPHSSTAHRALGWAAGRPQSAVHSSPFQSVKCGGGEAVLPSHHTSPSSVSAQLVKMELLSIARIAESLVFEFVLRWFQEKTHSFKRERDIVSTKSQRKESVRDRERTRVSINSGNHAVFLPYPGATPKNPTKEGMENAGQGKMRNTPYEWGMKMTHVLLMV